MKYICFCYYDTEKFAKLTRADFDEMRRELPPHDAALRATGRMVAQGSLSFPETWKTARPVAGKPHVTDGPYVQSPNQVGAFVIIEAASPDEAIAIASKHPAANYGEHIGFAIEVRECEMFELLDTDAEG
jgi:hypothetical protein